MSSSLPIPRPVRLQPASLSLVASPVGKLLVAATEDGLALLNFADDRSRDVLMQDAGYTPSAQTGRHHLGLAVDQLAAYFDRRRDAFDLALDLAAGTSFEQKVWRETCCIPYGRVASYGEVAERIGSPLAFRAVGGALGRNPVAIVVPCHRVLAKGGRIGGFSGGLAAKRTLLAHEGFLLRELTTA